MSKKILPVVVLAALLILGGFTLFGRGDKTYADITSFAKCLTEKGAVMYGAYWCPHCQNEKKAFGDAFRYVTYVECTVETQKCTDAKILGFPTWIFPDGRRFEGEQELGNLSRESGCQLLTASHSTN